MVKERKPHRLGTNKGQEKPQRFIFLDCESYLIQKGDNRIEHKFRMAWVLFWRRRPKRGKDTLIWYYTTQEKRIAEIIDQKASKKERLYIFAHNWNYDGWAAHILHNLQIIGYTMDPPYLSERTFICRMVKDSKKLILLDNAQFFPGKLDNLGKLVGLPKLTVDFETSDDATVKEYCKRDVEILYRLQRLWLEFIEKHNLGNYSITIPSQAFTAYRHRFMKTPIYIHNDEKTIELERAAYHGGRTSVFRQFRSNEGPFYKLDINSAYPWAMKHTKLPTRWLYTKEHTSLGEIKRYLEKYNVIAKVVIRTNEPVYPIKTRDHIVYPIGQFITTLTTPELKYAIAKGHIETVLTASLYTQDYVFKEYVDFFYRLKRKYKTEENSIFYYITKLFLNSLYGKWGQRGREVTVLPDNEGIFTEPGIVYNTLGEGYKRVYRIGKTMWIESTEGEAYNSFVGIAATITAAVRIKLWQFIIKAGRKNVYYTDTDSLIVNTVGYNNLLDELDENELGKLKIEEISNTIEITAPKVYKTEHTTKSKGVPQTAIKVGDNLYKYTEWPTLRIYARLDPTTPYYNVIRVKRLQNIIHDGKVTQNGWIVPYSYREIAKKIPLSDKAKERIAQLDLEIKALRETKRIPQSYMIILYDYKRGVIKDFAKDRPIKRGKRQMGYDEIATELGFTDTTELHNEVLRQISIDDEIAKRMEEKRIIKGYTGEYYEYPLIGDDNSNKTRIVTGEANILEEIPF